MDESLPSCLREEPDDEDISSSSDKAGAISYLGDNTQSTPISQKLTNNVIKARPVFRRVSLTSTDIIGQEIKNEKALYESSRLSSSLTSFSINDKDASTNSDSEESSSSQQHRKTSFSGPLFVSVPGLAPSSPGAGSTNSTPPHFPNNHIGGTHPDSTHSSPVSSRKQCYSPSQGMLLNGNNSRLSLSARKSGAQSPVCGLPAKSSPLISNSSSRKRSLDTMRSVDEGWTYPASKRALFSNTVSSTVLHCGGTTSSCNSPCSSTASPLMFQQSSDVSITCVDDKRKHSDFSNDSQKSQGDACIHNSTL